MLDYFVYFARLMGGIFTCSKTNTLSSMRLICVVGTFTLLIILCYMVYTKDERLNDCVTPIIGGITALSGFKYAQSRQEG